MTSPIAVSLGYAAVGGAAVVLGAGYASVASMTRRTRSLVQHGAAGTVLAGLVIDIFPKLVERPNQVVFTGIGLLIGLGGMLAIRGLLGGGDQDAGPTLLVTVLTDILVDGVLIGLSAALGSGTGLLFALALAPEMGLLGVTAAQQLRPRWPTRRVVPGAIAVGVAITGAGALGWLVAQASPAIQTAVLGAGASVIVYLILEELLREAHETDTGPLEVAVLFGAFIPFFLIGVAAS